MRLGKYRRGDHGLGQSLVETAIVMPILLLLVLNAVNLGYFFLIALNTSAAVRSGAEYSTLGFGSVAAILLPAAGPSSSSDTVSYLTFQDIPLMATGGTVQVCSKINGLSGSGTALKANCSTISSPTLTITSAAGTFSPAPPDPEAPWFVLNQVDMIYTFAPLIPGTPFGLTLLPTGVCTSASLTMTCSFHTKMAMRAMD